MKSVTLENSDTCITYALKRIGAETLLDGFDREKLQSLLDEHFYMLKYIGVASPGELLLFASNRITPMPRSISAAGVLNYDEIHAGLHMGVVESPGYFSHLSRNHDHGNYLPCIKIDEINRYKRLPDFVLRLK